MARGGKQGGRKVKPGVTQTAARDKVGPNTPARETDGGRAPTPRPGGQPQSPPR